MAIYITENGNVNYENQDDVNRELFPNEVSASKLNERLTALETTLGALTRELSVTGGQFIPKDNSVGNFITICKSGSVYTLFGFLRNVNIPTANSVTVIGRIQGVKPPANGVRGLCNVSDNAYSTGSPAYFVLGTSGNIEINSPVTGVKVIMLHCAWIVGG